MRFCRLNSIIWVLFYRKFINAGRLFSPWVDRTLKNRHITRNDIDCFSVSKKETYPTETFAKKILKGPRGEEYLDLILRDCVREFPYREGLLFQQVGSEV